jgi:hypothetical protein
VSRTGLTNFKQNSERAILWPHFFLKKYISGLNHVAAISNINFKRASQSERTMQTDVPNLSDTPNLSLH